MGGFYGNVSFVSYAQHKTATDALSNQGHNRQAHYRQITEFHKYPR